MALGLENDPNWPTQKKDVLLRKKPGSQVLAAQWQCNDQADNESRRHTSASLLHGLELPFTSQNHVLHPTISLPPQPSPVLGPHGLIDTGSSGFDREFLNGQSLRKFLGHANGVGVNLDGVLEAAGVTSGQDDGDGDVLRLCLREDETISPLQSFDREFQTA